MQFPPPEIAEDGLEGLGVGVDKIVPVGVHLGLGKPEKNAPS